MPVLKGRILHYNPGVMKFYTGGTPGVKAEVQKHVACLDMVNNPTESGQERGVHVSK